MRVLARLSVAAATVAFALLSTAPTALAGGPTSVLLVAPETGHTASLHTSDARYDRLLGALGETVTAPAGAPDSQSLPGTSTLTVTWLVHDTQVWRVDRVHPDGDGGPWVETWIAMDRVDLGQPGVVHRPTSSVQLLELLTELGVTDGSRTPPKVAERAAVSAAPGPVAQEANAIEWVWLLVGLAAGAVIVTAFRPVAGLLRERVRR